MRSVSDIAAEIHQLRGRIRQLELEALTSARAEMAENAFAWVDPRQDPAPQRIQLGRQCEEE